MRGKLSTRMTFAESFRILSEMKSVPIRRRLFLLAAASLLPIAIMSGAGLLALFHQQRSQAERAALEITRALTTAVDAELQRTISVLQVLATSGRLFTGEIGALEERMHRAAATQPTWRGVILADPEGKQLVNTRIPGGAGLPATADMASLLDVVRTGKPRVGHLTLTPRGTWAIPVRVPVIRDGRVEYVLTAPVKPDSILALAMRQKLADGWVVTAVDERGTRVMRWPRPAEYLGTPVSESLKRLMNAGGSEGTALTHTSEGNPVYTAYTRSPFTGWSVALGIPKSLVEAGALRSLLAYGGGVLLSILLGALAALAIARSINRPMEQLRRAARAVGEGERPSPPDTGIREIQDVADTLIAASEQRARSQAEREDLLQREQAARAAAEAANRSKDEFLAMLGHELRNPLSAISNAASLLETGKADASITGRASQIIARQVSHLTRLTDDLLDAGRALMGKIVLRPQALDLASIAAQSLATLKASGRTAGHTVVEEYDPAWVEADAIRLDQIISNLVVNAVKYTPAGGSIRVSVKREGPEAVLRVADTGIGLTPHLAARVFELFVQGDRELDRSQGGLGIGLTLVRRLAEMHGGTASVASAGPGQGSEFTVRLPTIEARTGEAPARGPAMDAPARDILIIEDNEDARETLRILLEMGGHRVETANDGTAGVEKALAMQPEVALIDVGLPKMDGYEVARRIREAAGGRRPYLVALTGYGAPEDRQRAFAAGFDAHVVKPVDSETLAEVMATSTSVLSGSGPR
jgi:signal transduction histidine kinase/ActR/RegA family two-component response regulator